MPDQSKERKDFGHGVYRSEVSKLRRRNKVSPEAEIDYAICGKNPEEMPQQTPEDEKAMREIADFIARWGRLHLGA